MKRLILIGRSEAGKSTLISALKNEKIEYHKTQYVDYEDFIIDTPGEYSENASLALKFGLRAIYGMEIKA